MIRRLQPGYKGGVSALTSHSDDKEKVRYCSRCEDLFQVQARLGPKIMLPDVPKPSDYDLWLECRNCGTIFAKHETKVEPVLEPIVEAQTSPFGKSKIKGITRKKARGGRGNNPRIKPRDGLKDEDLKRELDSGSVLLSYTSSDPI